MAVKPDSSAGYATGGRLFIAFIVVFFLLGYGYLSIYLGTIAGLTGGFISAWWNAKDDFVTDETTAAVIAEEMEEEKQGFRTRAVLRGMRLKSNRESRSSRAERDARMNQSERKLGWPFRRK